MTFWDHCNNSNKWKYLSFLPVTPTQILFKLAWLVVYSLIEIMWLFYYHSYFFLYKFIDPGLKQWHSMFLEENPNSYHGLKDSQCGRGQPLPSYLILPQLPSSLSYSRLSLITPSSSCFKAFVLVVPFAAVLWSASLLLFSLGMNITPFERHFLMLYSKLGHRQTSGALQRDADCPRAGTIPM